MKPYRIYPLLLTMCFFGTLIACGADDELAPNCCAQPTESDAGVNPGAADQGGQGGEAGQGGQGGEAGEGGQGGEAGQGGQAGEAAAFEIIYGDSQHDESPEVDEVSISANTEANHRLSFELHEFARESGGNTMLSAYSVRQAFGLLYPGSKGDTRSEIGQVMGFDSDLEVALKTLNAMTDVLDSRQLTAQPEQELEAVELSTANAFWGQRDLEWSQDYLNVLVRHFDIGLNVLDFVSDPELSRQVINQWVESKTNDRIVDLLPEGSVTSLTRSVLTNAVYFKAPWADSFQADSTRDEDFLISDGSIVSASTMVATDYGSIADTDDLLIVEKSFRGSKLAMTFVMPKTESLSDLESRLSAEVWAGWMDQLVVDNVELHLPKFEFETTLPLTDPLKVLGLSKLFDSPDLTGMLASGGLAVSGVFHKTFIAIDEGGAEAAAATAIAVGVTSVPPPPRLAQLNQPFLYAIRDIETGLILFFGRVADPR